jgi:hypothetical protein
MASDHPFWKTFGSMQFAMDLLDNPVACLPTCGWLQVLQFLA